MLCCTVHAPGRLQPVNRDPIGGPWQAHLCSAWPNRHLDFINVTACMTPTKGALRVLRGALLALTSASLSVAAHTAAGGAIPEPGITTVITLLMVGAGVAFADRRRGSRDIVGAVGFNQVALHVFLQVTGSHEYVHSTAQMPFDPLAMTVGHAVVAVLTALVLTGAESALFVIAKVLGLILPRKCATRPARTPFRARPLPAATVRVWGEVLYQRIHSRRGPPVLSG